MKYIPAELSSVQLITLDQVRRYEILKWKNSSIEIWKAEKWWATIIDVVQQ